MADHLCTWLAAPHRSQPRNLPTLQQRRPSFLCASAHYHGQHDTSLLEKFPLRKISAKDGFSSTGFHPTTTPNCSWQSNDLATSSPCCRIVLLAETKPGRSIGGPSTSLPATRHAQQRPAPIRSTITPPQYDPFHSGMGSHQLPGRYPFPTPLRHILSRRIPGLGPSQRTQSERFDKLLPLANLRYMHRQLR